MGENLHFVTLRADSVGEALEYLTGKLSDLIDREDIYMVSLGGVVSEDGLETINKYDPNAKWGLDFIPLPEGGNYFQEYLKYIRDLSLGDIKLSSGTYQTILGSLRSIIDNINNFKFRDVEDQSLLRASDDLKHLDNIRYAILTNDPNLDPPELYSHTFEKEGYPDFLTDGNTRYLIMLDVFW
jgi:hypothetical protein